MDELEARKEGSGSGEEVTMTEAKMAAIQAMHAPVFSGARCACCMQRTCYRVAAGEAMTLVALEQGE